MKQHEFLLVTKDLKVVYQARRRALVHAVNGVSLAIRQGCTLGLVGESGSGKSSLGNAVAGLVGVQGGLILFDGEDITRADRRRRRQLAREIQVVFQDPFASLNPSRSIGATLADPLRYNLGLNHSETQARVEELLSTVGLSLEAARRYPAEFSGGQRQRIAIARALAVEPKLIICDEPTSALDVSVQAQILNLLRDLQEQKALTYLFISHNLSVVRHMADDIAVMRDGNIVECQRSEDLYRNPHDTYTKQLLAASQDDSPPATRRVSTHRSTRVDSTVNDAAVHEPASAPIGDSSAARLAPAVEAFLESESRFPPPDQLTWPEKRRAMTLVSDALFREFGEPGPHGVLTEEHRVPGPGGSVRVRIYRPDDDEIFPVHVVLHGGGWCYGSIDELIVDAQCRERATSVGVAVVAVEYALAPEHRYPDGLRDAYAVLEWVSDHGAALGLDALRVSVGGASAGANLAAALALKTRDEGGPRIMFQLLEAPALDLSMRGISNSPGDDHGLSPKSLTEAIDRYLGGNADPSDPLVSPLLATDMSDLPTTHIVIGELDMLAPQGELYAGLLRDAGTDVSISRHKGAIHATTYMTRTWEGARLWRDDVLSALRQAHAPAKTSGNPRNLDHY